MATKKKKAASKKKPSKKKHVQGNPYRAQSFYAICFDCLSRLGTKKAVTRKALLKAYCKASGKDEKRARYDLAVILSPTKEGKGHKSSKMLFYYVERLADTSMVRLHMAK